MTNRIALVLGLLITAGFVTDILLFGDAHMIFLGKKMVQLIDWIAFWR